MASRFLIRCAMLGVLAACLVPNLSRADAFLPLWPQGAPGAKGTASSDTPTVEFYLPLTAKLNGAGVVICPGGGYQGLAYLKEGTAVAQWLNTLGVAAFVLKYRLGPTYRHPIEMNDAQRAMRFVRANASRFAIDTSRLGILGFSAGGHLASTVATHFDAGNPSATDPVDRHSSRPAFQILVYPVITMDASFTHGGSRNNLLGPSPSQALVDSLSNEKQVTARTPPAFIVHTKDDAAVPVKNAQVYNDSLKKKGVPVELRLYESGPHGFGMADGKNTAPNLPEVATWTGFAAQWMEARGFFRKSTAVESRRGPEAKPSGPPKTWLAWARDLLGRHR